MKEEEKFCCHVSTQNSLKVKQHEVFMTNPTKENLEQEENEIYCHHITVVEDVETEIFEENVEEAPLLLENGSQLTVDELKEVNLWIIDKMCPNFYMCIILFIFLFFYKT